jgi:hypothetical protein
VFLWYEDDFGGRDGTLEFVVRHAPAGRRAELARAAAGHRLRFAPHAWSLNAGTGA